MRDVHPAQAVGERVGAADGHATTLYLHAQPGCGWEFPRELRPRLCDFMAAKLPDGAVVSEEVSNRKKREGAFVKIVLSGYRPKEALALVRRVKAWFFEYVVPEPLKRDQNRARRTRRARREAVNRRTRFNGRRWCHQQIGLAR